MWLKQVQCTLSIDTHFKIALITSIVRYSQTYTFQNSTLFWFIAEAFYARRKCFFFLANILLLHHGWKSWLLGCIELFAGYDKLEITQDTNGCKRKYECVMFDEVWKGDDKGSLKTLRFPSIPKIWLQFICIVILYCIAEDEPPRKKSYLFTPKITFRMKIYAHFPNELVL